MKHKRMLILLSVLFSVIASILVFPTLAPPPPGVPSRRPLMDPQFKLVLADYQTERPLPPGRSHITVQCEEKFDTWLYVSNPSTDMSTSPPIIDLRQPDHTVEVQELTVVITKIPDEPFDPLTFTPEDPEFLSYRWDPVVNPGEESLVFFIGWTYPESCDDTSLPATYEYEYTLTATFEGEEFMWTEVFEVEVTPLP